MARSPRARSRRRLGERGSRNAGTDALAAATLEAAIIYWRWLGDEFPRYAKAVSSELTGLKGRKVGAKEAAVRIARLTQEYTQILGDLPRRILEQVDGPSLFPESPGSRRRQGRVID
jgi:hypothetical protein